MLVIDWKNSPVIDRTKEDWMESCGFSLVDGLWFKPKENKPVSSIPAKPKEKRVRVPWDESVLVAEIKRINTISNKKVIKSLEGESIMVTLYEIK